MEKLILKCDSCLEVMGDIIKEVIEINDYLIKDYDREGKLVISSVLRCQCGEYVILSKDKIIKNYEEEI